MNNNPFPNLHRQQFINLTTYRKSGQPIVTTVWFAQAGDTLYGMFVPQAGKIKRMHNNPAVNVAPSTLPEAVLGVPQAFWEINPAQEPTA